MKEHIDVAKDFIDFISESPTKYHAIENVKSKLLQHKFESLSIDEKWDLKPHGRYFIEQDNSALIAFCMSSREPNILFDLMAHKLNVSKEDILDYELYLYPIEKGRLVGVNSDFIVTPRQDDLVMVYAALQALTDANSELSKTKLPDIETKIQLSDANADDATRMIAFFDAEEETNSTLGGADTPLLRNVLTKVVKSIGGNEEDVIKLINHSFAVSLDTSFAAHPNYMECSDPTCSPIINKGVVIKYDANMHYATTAFSSAVFQEACNRKNIPFQKAAANSDLRTGGTISAFMQTQVEIKCVEIGISTWAMHSAYESCGTADLFNLIGALKSFWLMRD